MKIRTLSGAFAAAAFCLALAACQSAPAQQPISSMPEAGIVEISAPPSTAQQAAPPSAVPTAAPALAPSPTPDAAILEAYKASCVFLPSAEMDQKLEEYLGQDVFMCGRVQEVRAAAIGESTVIFHEEDSPYCVVQAMVSGDVSDLKPGEFIMAYGTYGGPLADYPLTLEHSTACSLSIVTYDTFVSDPALEGYVVDEAFLNGTWMKTPQKNAEGWGIIYTFDGEALEIEDYYLGKPNSIFTGKYFFSRPNRVHHRYKLKSYSLETGELYGEYTGKLNYDIEVIAKDVIKMGGGIFFRVG